VVSFLWNKLPDLIADEPVKVEFKGKVHIVISARILLTFILHYYFSTKPCFDIFYYE